MGTDVHPVVQVRRDGKWESLDDLGPRYDGDYDWTILDNRNYTLFAALADVRNGYGVAGVYRHEPLKPLAPRRGLPDDLEHEENSFGEPAVRVGEGARWLGDHSHTWMTLAELLAYDWDFPLLQGGWLTVEQYRRWDKRSVPDSFCGGASGPGVVGLTEEEYVKMESIPTDDGKLYYVICQWQTPLRDRMSDFCDKVIPCLQSLGAPEDVRIVMGFDS